MSAFQFVRSPSVLGRVAASWFSNLRITGTLAVPEHVAMERLRIIGFRLSLVVLLSAWPGTTAATQSQPAGPPREYVNNLGVKMIRIPTGSFRMGNDLATDPKLLKQSPVLATGDYDERPVNEVRITYNFYMSETEITARQYADFRQDYEDMGPASPYATGMSWEEAVAFCEWLSRKEGKQYRLPTEAEWEYACRAGSTAHFHSGDQPPASGEVNAWGLKNMHTDAAEWVLDWHGLYPHEPQTDPVGPRTGYAKVVRGGGLCGPYLGSSTKYPNDGRLPYYRRSANRASVAPIWRGRHPIGFRIVEAPLPKTPPWNPPQNLAEQFVKQTNPHLKLGPDANKPWFRQRHLLPIPPADATEEEVRAAGLPPGVLGFNHNPGLTVCPNGDLLAVFFSASVPNVEDLANVSVIGTRLRFGSDQWDMPSLFFDFADTKDTAPCLWTEGNTLYFCDGGSGLDDLPFRWRTSDDNGATWWPVHFPLIYGLRGGYFPQPIARGFHGLDDIWYLPSDGLGGESFLWASRDRGRTWSDTGGRTGGRHTVFVVLKDGSILGMGGKASNIDGFMPKSISRDGGRTWTITKTQFASVGKNQQRPTLLRLASGGLFFAADWQNADGEQPPGITDRGSFVALSDDEGQTWKTKSLPGVLPNLRYQLRQRPDWGPVSPLKEGTLGYAISAQSPNGVIHLVTSANHPPQHFEMNEAWVLSDAREQTRVTAGTGALTPDREAYSDGKPKATWSGRRDNSGRYVMSGIETWRYSDGTKQYEATWRDGIKTGVETHWDIAGRKIWQWEHQGDEAVWTQFWPSGRKARESRWQAGRCSGEAVLWDQSGNVLEQYNFTDGEITQ